MITLYNVLKVGFQYANKNRSSGIVESLQDLSVNHLMTDAPLCQGLIVAIWVSDQEPHMMCVII